jgi:hypothetical protein
MPGRGNKHRDGASLINGRNGAGIANKDSIGLRIPGTAEQSGTGDE